MNTLIKNIAIFIGAGIGTGVVMLAGVGVAQQTTPTQEPVQTVEVPVVVTATPTLTQPVQVQTARQEAVTTSNKISCDIMGDTFYYTPDECAYWQNYWAEKYAETMGNMQTATSERVGMPEPVQLETNEVNRIYNDTTFPTSEPFPTQAPLPDFAPVKDCKWVQNNLKGYLEEVCE